MYEKLALLALIKSDIFLHVKFTSRNNNAASLNRDSILELNQK